MARTSCALAALMLAVAGGATQGQTTPAPAGAADAPMARTVQPGAAFALRPGQVAVLAGTGLRVGFEGVSADSRCPQGEMCVSAGDATVQVWVLEPGKLRQHRALHTATGRPSQLPAGDHNLHLLDLQPAPVSGRAIAPDAYVATFRLVEGEAQPLR